MASSLEHARGSDREDYFFCMNEIRTGLSREETYEYSGYCDS